MRRKQSRRDSELAVKIHRAAVDGDKDKLSQLLPDATAQDFIYESKVGEQNRTMPVLAAAAFLGYSEIVDMLLQTKKVDINYLDVMLFGTALTWTLREGHVAVLAVLIRAGVDVNRMDIKTKKSPLMLAAFCNNNATIVEMLLQAGADDGVNVLITAVRLGDVAVIQLLLRHDINVNAHQQEQGWSALTMAAQLGHIFVVEVLLQAGADVNAQDSSGNFALLQACTYGHVSVMDKLLQSGADVNAQNEDGKTALISAAWLGQVQTVVLLLQAGADVNMYDEFGLTALMRAASSNHSAVVDVLLQAGADVHMQSRRKETAIMLAKDTNIKKKIEEYVQQLEDNIYRAAITNNQLKLRQLLFSAKCADLLYVSRQNNKVPALIEAALRGHLETVKLLIKSKKLDVQEQLQLGRAQLSAEQYEKVKNLLQSAELQVRADMLLYPYQLRQELLSAQDRHTAACRLGFDDQQISVIRRNVQKLARQCEDLQFLMQEEIYAIVRTIAELSAEIQQIFMFLQHTEQFAQIELLEKVLEELNAYNQEMQQRLVYIHTLSDATISAVGVEATIVVEGVAVQEQNEWEALMGAFDVQRDVAAADDDELSVLTSEDLSTLVTDAHPPTLYSANTRRRV